MLFRSPHDIQIRELTSGKSRIETALELGLRFNIAPKLSIEDGRDAVRMILPLCFFDEEKTKRGILALRNYKKEFDIINKCFKLNHKHDWASHGADAFRYIALMISEPRRTQRKQMQAAPQHWMA